MSTKIYIPYTYRIYHIPTKQYYYGSRTANNKNSVANPLDLWKTYFTSSKTVKELISKYGEESFIIQRIKKFKTKEDALFWEAKFLNRINAANNPNFLNKRNGDWKFYINKISLERKEAARQRKLGSKLSQESKDKIKEKLKGNKNCLGRSGEKHPLYGKTAYNKGVFMSEEQKNKLRKPKSEQHKIKLSISHKGINIGKIWINNGKITKFINPWFLDLFISQGFNLGRKIESDLNNIL